MQSGTTDSIHDVWGSSSADVFAVGDGGTILHYDGSTWNPMQSGTIQILRGIWGSSSAYVFAVGWNSTILHYDGSTWSPMQSWNRLELHFLGVWGSSSSDVFAVGYSGLIEHYDGSIWKRMPIETGTYLKEGILGVWGTSSSDVFAVGLDGLILHYDGSTWRSMSIDIIEDLMSIWGSSSLDIFSVGDSGTILHYDEEYTAVPTRELEIPRIPPVYTNGEVSILSWASAKEVEDWINQGLDINGFNATIQGSLELNGLTIPNKLSFAEATFEDDVIFREVHFKGDVIFRQATFKGMIYFWNCTFDNEVSFEGTRFEKPVSFPDTIFKGGDNNFYGAHFNERASFARATFQGRAMFSDSNFEDMADFHFVIFEDDAVFSLARFGDADFHAVEFNKYADFRQATVDGNMRLTDSIWSGQGWPPHRVGGSIDLQWRDVKDTMPSEYKTEVYSAWENLFSTGGQFSSARQVRTAMTRYELRFFIYGLATSFSAVLIIFTGLYCWYFRRTRLRSWYHFIFIGKTLLFSLDVLTPGIGPWKYDWKWQHRDGTPVRSNAVLTAIESAIGWILLATGSALAVAWLIA